MTIKESIQRLQWRLKKSITDNKPFMPNKNDAKALNAIIDFYDKASTDNYQKNELMFKMYVWHRIELMKHYNEDIFGSIAIKQLAKALDMPVQSYINRFTAFLNESEYKVLATKINPVKKPYFLLSEDQKNESIKKLQKMLVDNPELFKTLTGDVWSKEDVKENLVAEFNQLLQVCG